MSKNVLGIFEEIVERFEINDNIEAVIWSLAEGHGDYIPYDHWDTFVEEYGYKHIKQEGGGEGGAEYCFGIFQILDKFYKAEYSYYSYNGYEYGDISDTVREVKPVEKLITVYE